MTNVVTISDANQVLQINFLMMGGNANHFAKQYDCLKTILKHLAISPRCVEDDTCFGRILQSIDVVLKSNQKAGMYARFI